MQVQTYKKAHRPLGCHHIIHYHGKQSLFIKDMLQFKFKHAHSVDIRKFLSCKLCLNCAYKLFIQSKGLKVFERFCLNPNPVVCLHIISQIIGHPQIYFCISRNKQLFTSFFKMTIAAIFSLTSSELPKGDMVFLWETILDVLLSLCIKPRHLKWIMRLKQLKCNDAFGNNSWHAFIAMPFQHFIKEFLLNQDINARETYANWIAMHLMIHNAKFRNKYRNKLYIQQAMDEVNYSQYAGIINFKQTKELLIESKTVIQEKTFLKYFLYYDDAKCQNKRCKKKYLKHKFGVDHLKMKKNISDRRLPKMIRKFYICKGCKLTFYCSRRCQKVDWKVFNHKRFCVYVQQTLY